MGLDVAVLVQAAPDVIAVLDRDRRYAFLNPAFEVATGLVAREWIGTSQDDLMPAAEAVRWREAIEAVRSSRAASQLECTIDTPRGRRRFAWLISILDDEHVLVIGRDVTDISAGDRARRLQDLTAALSSAIDKQQVATIFVDAGCRALGAATGYAWLLRDDETLELVCDNNPDSALSLAPFQTLEMNGALPICDAIRRREPVMFENRRAMAIEYPAAAASSHTTSGAWAMIPFIVDGRSVGASSFSFASERVFTIEDRELLVAMSGQASLALERCRLLEAHQRSEEQLRTALAAAHAGTWSIDLATMASHRDPSYLALLGIHTESPIADFGLVHPADRDSARAAFERTVRDGSPYEPILRVRRGDGSYIWVHAYGRLTYDADHKPKTLAGVIIDIDDARRTSMRAEDERRLNDTLHRLASSFASELDQDRLIQRIIDETTKLIDAESGAFWPGDLSSSIGNLPSGASTLVAPIVTRPGELFGHLLFRHPDRDRFTSEHERLVKSIANQAAISLENARLYTTVREQKAALEVAIEHARAADRRKDEFLAMLGHELRNPLAPIAIALDLMDLKGTELAAKEREVIRRQVTHMSRLIDDLLDVSRIMRGKVQLAKETIAVASIVAKAIEMASPLLERRMQRLDVRHGEGELLIEADPERLAQVFQNLLTNAAKYSDPSSTIELTTTGREDTVTISVRDHGIGIAAELLPRMFDIFVQGERALDRADGGLGIGLTLARNLCEQHGGTITATSDGPGTGSTFSVTLPRSTRARIPTEPMRALRRLSRAAEPARVLVVDDNVDAALMLRETLIKLGHELQVAHDGPTALELAAQFKPDIAVLDIGLPVMSGYELARKLREQRGANELRLIALTGYGQETDRVRSREVGFDHHLIKPIELDALLSLLTK